MKITISKVTIPSKLDRSLLRCINDNHACLRRNYQARHRLATILGCSTSGIDRALLEHEGSRFAEPLSSAIKEWRASEEALIVSDARLADAKSLAISAEIDHDIAQLS